MTGFPRPPQDDEEREACENNRANVYGGCSTEQRKGRGWWCSRAKGHAGDHIATGGRHFNAEVLARWPASPAPSVDDVMDALTITDDDGPLRLDAAKVRALLHALGPEALAAGMAGLNTGGK